MQLDFVPLALRPEPPFSLRTPVEFVPGTWLQVLSPHAKEMLAAYYKTLPVAVEGGHEFAFVIDRAAFTAGIRNRHADSNLSADWLTSHHIAKLFVMAYFLAHPTAFRLGPELSGSFEKAQTLIRIGSCANYAEEKSDYHLLGPVLAIEPLGRSTRSHVRSYMLLLECYFRWDQFRVDRIGASLAHLWSSLCTPYHEQALLSACAGLEALASTGDKGEITHQLSERIALLLQKPGKGRHDLYKDLKKIYGMRSSVIHGTYLRRGRMDKPWPERLSISPRSKFFDVKYLREATRLLVLAIRAFLDDVDLTRICAAENDQELLRDYFERRLLGG